MLGRTPRPWTLSLGQRWRRSNIVNWRGCIIYRFFRYTSMRVEGQIISNRACLRDAVRRWNCYWSCNGVLISLGGYDGPLGIHMTQKKKRFGILGNTVGTVLSRRWLEVWPLPGMRMSYWAPETKYRNLASVPSLDSSTVFHCVLSNIILAVSIPPFAWERSDVILRVIHSVCPFRIRIPNVLQVAIEDLP